MQINKLIYIYTFTFICILYFLGANYSNNTGSLITGWFVTDGITLFNAAIIDSQLPLDTLVENNLANLGLAILNSSLVSVHPLAPAIVNCIALGKVYTSIHKNTTKWAFVLLAFTPLYLVSILLPSKDIIVLFIFCFCIKKFLAIKAKSNITKIAPTILLCTTLLFIRDGFGVILISTIVIIFAIEKINLSKIISLILLLVASSMFLAIFSTIFQDEFIVVRSLDIASQSTVINIDNIEKPFSYIIRLFGNATNLAFRPVIFDINGNLNVLALSFWISGLTLLQTIFYCCIAIRKTSITDQRLGMLGLILLIIISITPYVQPRYLLPICMFIPLFSFTTVANFLKGIACITVISLLASFIYINNKNYPPPPTALPFSMPSI